VDSVWEAIFLLLVLKIPMIYLGLVVWWAIRAEPEPSGGGGEEAGVLAPLDPCGWDEWRRNRRTSRRVPRPFKPVAPHARRLAAGFLCAFSLALSGIALAREPAVLAPAAIVVALVAARMTQTHRTLATVTLAVATLAFFFGMVVAISTDNSVV
jgi:hypothetical protein